MKVIYNKIIPFGRYGYMNLFGILFAKSVPSIRTLNHEKIHTAQMKELLYIGFYLWYIIEWLIKLVYYRNNYKAYKNISFEREAYENEHNFNYLKERRHYGFQRFI